MVANGTLGRYGDAGLGENLDGWREPVRRDPLLRRDAEAPVRGVL